MKLGTVKQTLRKIGSSDFPSEVKFSLSIKPSSSVESWEAPLDERGSPTVCMLDTKLHSGKSSSRRGNEVVAVKLNLLRVDSSTLTTLSNANPLESKKKIRTDALHLLHS